MRLIQPLLQILTIVITADVYGTILSLVVIFFLLTRKETHLVSLTYAIGSFLAFLVGSLYNVIDFMGVTLGNVIGVAGGYLLLLLVLIQYLFEKRAISKTIIEQ